MNRIEYLYQDGIAACSREPLEVRLNGRVCGEIRKINSGYQYFSKGIKLGGEIFKTVGEVQRDIEGE